MSKLTREQIEALRPHERNERLANKAMHALCDMALRSLDRDAVIEECALAVEHAANFHWQDSASDIRAAFAQAIRALKSDAAIAGKGRG